MPILCLRGRIGARETHQVEAEKKDRAGLNVFIEEGFSQIASKFFFMKSNDCGNQRLFGGLQIWRERRRRIEKRPRLGAGQRVHRGARGAGVGGGSPYPDKSARGEPRRGPPHPRERTRKVDVVLRQSVPGRGRGGSYPTPLSHRLGGWRGCREGCQESISGAFRAPREKRCSRASNR